LEVDYRKTASILTEASKSNRRKTVLKVRILKPERTTAEAKSMGIKTLVSSFTTYFPPGKPRVKNIQRAAEILDRRLIPPGVTFSFNGYVGQRTPDRDFVEAPEIRDGQLVPTTGGGICQVATTFFNTILLGGYPFGQRSPHSLFISKYPTGRDAAVSWPSPDLTFTNDTSAWILIKTGYSGSSISINFYSTDYSREVSFETKFLGWIAYSTKVIKDKTLEKGKRKEKQAGKRGRTIEVTRIIVKDGKVIKRETFISRYRPEERIVLEGTKKPKPKKEEQNKTEDQVSSE
jgi:vancomycin resistance protein YoaR